MSISSTIESSTWSQLNFWITQKFNLEVELFYYPKVQPIVFFINSYFTWVELLDNQKVQPMLLVWTLLLSKSSTVLVVSFILYVGVGLENSINWVTVMYLHQEDTAKLSSTGQLIMLRVIHYCLHYIQQ